jgi:hypothetical protein
MWTFPLIRDYVLGQLACWPLCIRLFQTWIYIFIFVSYGGIWNINPFLTLQSNTNIKEYGCKLLYKICNFNAKSILCLVFILQTAIRDTHLQKSRQNGTPRREVSNSLLTTFNLQTGLNSTALKYLICSVKCVLRNFKEKVFIMVRLRYSPWVTIKKNSKIV